MNLGDLKLRTRLVLGFGAMQEQAVDALRVGQAQAGTVGSPTGAGAAGVRPALAATAREPAAIH